MRDSVLFVRRLCCPRLAVGVEVDMLLVYKGAARVRA